MCTLSWRKQWSPEEKNKFNQVLVEELSCFQEEQVLLGFENMDISGDGLQMFNCQLRLFRNWFKSWSAQERDNFVRQLMEAEPDLAEFLRNRNVL